MRGRTEAVNKPGPKSGTNPAGVPMDDGGTHSEWRATTVFDKTTKDREVAKRERDTTAAGASILSIVAKEMHIKGNCETDGLMRIEGKISGNVIAQGVELLASGSVAPGILVVL